jgi:hypothetical protein
MKPPRKGGFFVSGVGRQPRQGARDRDHTLTFT